MSFLKNIGKDIAKVGKGGATPRAAGRGSRSASKYSGVTPPPTQKWMVPDKSPPIIPSGMVVQFVSTGDLYENVAFVVRQCAQKMPYWTGWTSVRELSSETYWKNNLPTGSPRHTTVDDTQITITPRLATCDSIKASSPKYRADLVFDIAVWAPDPETSVSRPEPTSTQAPDNYEQSDNENRSLKRKRTVRTGFVMFSLPAIGMSTNGLTSDPSRGESNYPTSYQPATNHPDNECAPGDNFSAVAPPSPNKLDPLPPFSAFLAHDKMKEENRSYSVEYAHLQKELAAGLGRPLSGDEKHRLMHLTQLRVHAQNTLATANRQQAAMDTRLALLRYLEKKQAAGADFTFGPDEGVPRGVGAYLGEVGDQIKFQYARNKSHIKGIVHSFEQSSARYHKVGMKSGNPFAPMLSGFMAAAEMSIQGITNGQKTATEAIAELLAARSTSSKAIASLKIALGLGEMVLNAADLVLPVAKTVGKISRGGKMAGKLAHAHNGGGARGSAIANATVLAPKSLSTNTIMMAVGKSGRNAAGTFKPKRHADFHGPWRGLPANKKFPWGEYLKKLLGYGAPASMKHLNPHGHHILFKKGLSKTQQGLVDEAQDILRRRAGIDPIWDVENLVFAPNGFGQHTTKALRMVVEKIKAVDAADGTRDDFIRALRELAEVAASRGK